MPSLPCHRLSPLALLIAFYRLPSSPITTAKIAKLFLEPLGMFVLLSGMWSRPCRSGAGAAASKSSALMSVPVPPLSTATTTDRPAHRPPGHRHFVLGVNHFRHLWTPLGDFGDIPGERVSKYGRGKNLEPSHEQDPSMPDDSLSLGSAWEDPLSLWFPGMRVGGG